MASIHVDEKAGSDVTGQGSPDQPYETLAFALFTHQASSPKYLIRKDPSGTYEEPTQSALKKAKKGADGLEKKRKKADEAAAKAAQADSEERERREKLLADSKKIVLKEDETLPKATRARPFISSQIFRLMLIFHGRRNLRT
jgi:asparaginyl-tRNA synthetase